MTQYIHTTVLYNTHEHNICIWPYLFHTHSLYHSLSLKHFYLFGSPLRRSWNMMWPWGFLHSAGTSSALTRGHFRVMVLPSITVMLCHVARHTGQGQKHFINTDTHPASDDSGSDENISLALDGVTVYLMD